MSQAKWNLIVDVANCTNCNNCTLAVQDEHVGNSFPGYAAEMPKHGHRWIDIRRRERGQGTMTDVAYLPTMCQHCDDAPCMAAAKDDAMKLRLRAGDERLRAISGYRRAVQNVILDVKNALDSVVRDYRLIEQAKLSRIAQGEALLRMLAGRRASSANAARSEQAARAFKAALGADGLPPECRGEVEARAEMARQAAIAANPACAQS